MVVCVCVFFFRARMSAKQARDQILRFARSFYRAPTVLARETVGLQYAEFLASLLDSNVLLAGEVPVVASIVEMWIASFKHNDVADRTKPGISTLEGYQEAAFDENSESEKNLRVHRRRVLSVEERNGWRSNMIYISYLVSAAFCRVPGAPFRIARTVHVAINVAEDGSCFYQCLAYALSWIRPRCDWSKEIRPMARTVLSVKEAIITRLTGVNLRRIRETPVLEKYYASIFIKPNMASVVEPILDVLIRDKEIGRDVTTHEKVTIALLMDLMGVKRMPSLSVYNADGTLRQTGFMHFVSNSRKFASDAAIQMAALAYGVQIIVYQLSHRGWALLMGATGVSASNTEIQMEVSRNNGSLQRVACFTGHPIVLLLHVNGDHFQLLSLCPDLHGTTSNGRVGQKGMYIPASIRCSMPPRTLYGEGLTMPPRMPAMQKCMACRGWIPSMDG